MNNLYKILSYSTLGTLCAFLIQILSANILTVYEYGVIGKWLTDLSFLSIFLVFGLDNSLLFFSKNNNEFFSKNFYKNIVFFTIISIFLLVTSTLSNNILYYSSLIVVCYILAIVQSLNAFNLLNSSFNKYGLINLVRNLIIFLILLVFYIIDSDIDSSVYIKIYMLSMFLVLAVVVPMSYKPKIKIINIKMSIDRLYLKYGFKSMSNTLFAVLLYSSTVYVLDFYETKESVGVFFAATVFSKLAWVIPDSIGNLLYPKYLKIGDAYSKEDVFKETYFFAQLNLFLNILSILAFYFIGKFVIDILYGSSYLNMFWIVIILLIGNQGMVFYKILGRYQASINEWKTQRVALILAIFSNIILN
uniref:lipopolysaccharide biosynthesis protein n=1 Tax=Psychrobacter immobilis TaxID=498 RepID=UPI00191A2E93